jgi:hypothetical protein
MWHDAGVVLIVIVCVIGAFYLLPLVLACVVLVIPIAAIGFLGLMMYARTTPDPWRECGVNEPVYWYTLCGHAGVLAPITR